MVGAVCSWCWGGNKGRQGSSLRRPPGFPVPGAGLIKDCALMTPGPHLLQPTSFHSPLQVARGSHHPSTHTTSGLAYLCCFTRASLSVLLRSGGGGRASSLQLMSLCVDFLTATGVTWGIISVPVPPQGRWVAGSALLHPHPQGQLHCAAWSRLRPHPTTALPSTAFRERWGRLRTAPGHPHGPQWLVLMFSSGNMSCTH